MRSRSDLRFIQCLSKENVYTKGLNSDCHPRVQKDNSRSTILFAIADTLLLFITINYLKAWAVKSKWSEETNITRSDN